jgi:hypothetical protein
MFDHITSSHKVQPLGALIAYFTEKLNAALPLLEAQSSAALDAAARVVGAMPLLEANAQRVIASLDVASAQMHAAVDAVIADAR